MHILSGCLCYVDNNSVVHVFHCRLESNICTCFIKKMGNSESSVHIVLIHSDLLRSLMFVFTCLAHFGL